MPKASPDTLKAFGDELAAAIRAAEMTRAQVAAELGLTSSQAVDNYANGDREPDVRTVARLEAILDCRGRLLPLLGYPVQMSAHGKDLDDLKDEAPEEYERLQVAARKALDKVRKRQGG